ncbi:di-heme oxidoredictase family protein [Rhodobacter sp. TJ_12]|uniref:di-heme oxidoredictase family protein n=1 Tax=Rhodobacter sp. TJ_12 TaxID=2029399 RepID=UPI001CBABCDF|nr:di-heme oxidoredictase family protein [Rhodobacter sp. TJ_12]
MASKGAKRTMVALALGAAAMLSAVGLRAASGPDWVTDAAGPAPFAQPIASDDPAVLDQRMLGRSFFTVPWVAAPAATTARDGLGPLFNANSCASCHVDNGSAPVIDADGAPLRPLLFKLAQPDAHADRMGQDAPESPGHARVLDPIYGGQIAINAAGGARPEARPQVHAQAVPFHYPDGAAVTLTRLTPVLADLAHGPLAPDTVVFLRQPPALAGLGLVAAVPDAALVAWEDPDDADGDGISGRANRMPDGALGRYGWKAAEPTLVAQIANAAAVDMGLTNRRYPQELCPPAQIACQKAPRGRPSPLGDLDLPDPRLDAIAAYLSGFKAPQPAALAAQAAHGESLFSTLGCAACHRPVLRTEDGRTLRPLSDFLLHDMGDGLADGVREHLAGPSEFRTAPLWGLGARLRAGHRFLHDGRARSPEEAILWHGGEAGPARDAFVSLTAADRAALLSYLEQL